METVILAYTVWRETLVVGKFGEFTTKTHLVKENLPPHGALFFTLTTSAFTISIAFGGTTSFKELLGSGNPSSCISMGTRLRYFKIDIVVAHLKTSIT